MLKGLLKSQTEMSGYLNFNIRSQSISIWQNPKPIHIHLAKSQTEICRNLDERLLKVLLKSQTEMSGY